MPVGRMILHRFNGTEEFALTNAEMLAYTAEDGVCLCLEAKTDGVCLKSLSDTAEFHGTPSAQARVTVPELIADRLVGLQFSVPFGYDEDLEDDVASFYYFEHEDLDENVIDVVSREGNIFRVRWTGTTMDVNHYDGSKPPTKVVIEGDFTFLKMEKWMKP
jgi:hypothetical protein